MRSTRSSHRAWAAAISAAAIRLPGFKKACYYGTWSVATDGRYLQALAKAGLDVTISGFLKVPDVILFLVKATEAELGVRLLDSESGGADGGGSRLTPEARDLCRRFRRVSSGIQEVVSRRFAVEFGENKR